MDELRAVRVDPSLIVEEIEGQLLVLDMARNVYFGLNPVGLTIWRGLERGEDVEALTAAVMTAFEVDAPRARHDVESFLRQLIARGLAREASR